VGLAAGSAPGGYFCTGEIVSDQGLLFTNHHCGFNYIQEHSTIDKDYLTNGFWAMSLEEELPNEGLTASFLVRMEDVSKRMLEALSDTMSEETRAMKIAEVSEDIQKENSSEGKYDCVVKPFFGGNEFYLFVYQTYKDVRLVGTPPSSIGKFGGDTDNWMWPRHTGDFCVFRVYAAPDGSPATYSKNNVPLKPKHFLPVSIKGVQKNDYAMVWGYPGTTDRFLTSWGVNAAITQTNPTTVQIRDLKLRIMKEDMNADPKINLMYAAKHAGTANYWKYYIGQTRGLKRLGVLEEKQAQEAAFTQWLDQDASRKAKYGDALNLIVDGYRALDPFNVPMTYMSEAVFQGPEIISLAMRSGMLMETMKKMKEAKGEEKKKLEESVKKYVDRLRKRGDDFFKDYNMSTDKKLFAGMMEMYYKNVAKDMQMDAFAIVDAKYKGDVKRWADDVYNKSIFCDKARLEAFLNDPSLKVLEKDPAVLIALSARAYANQMYDAQAELQSKIERGNRLYIAGLREMNPAKKIAPDANSTMRVTYGSVLDYYPADAVHYNLFTTLSGVMEKEDPSNAEFIVDPKLKELYEKKDFGRYGSKINGRDDLVTCFLTTNDITGGNSGSPVINANGELIGLAFDGNWEAMSGDIAFEPQLQRTICADVRYVLFVIEKMGGCTRLINEMKIVE
jgi:hypothetical protein